MNAIGIDVSKGKSTVAVLRPYGEVVFSPFDVAHTGSDLRALADLIKKLPGETKVVMEATGNYFESIAHYLHEQNIFVSVVNPVLISDFGGNTLRKPKTDKKDSVKIASYALTYWLDLKEYTPQEDLRKSLKLMNRQYQQSIKLKTMMNNNLISLLDLTFPGINKLFTSPSRESDGHEKWVDFVLEFPHCDMISKLTIKAFAKKYKKRLLQRNTRSGPIKTHITSQNHHARKYTLLQRIVSAAFLLIKQSFSLLYKRQKCLFLLRRTVMPYSLK